MLCAENLALLETQSSFRSELSLSSENAFSDTSSRVAVARDPAGHSSGHTKSLDGCEKWVDAALRKLKRSREELLLPSLEPNDALCSEVHSVVAHWAETRVTALKAGVHESRDKMQSRPAPEKVLTGVRGCLRRYINRQRYEQKRLPVLPEKWAQNLAGRRADTMAVRKVVMAKKRNNGTLFHHKHDLAPTQEQLQAMMLAGWMADQRVDADELCAIEAGMAVALYLPTGARGSELKHMHLQSIGHELIQHAESGLEFDCIKMTAFETKVKEQHLNQLLLHSDPRSNGCGLLGLSILVRVKRYGPPPLTMSTDENSWKFVGTNAETLDRRLEDLFGVAGVRRQAGDPLTYLGRHFGTRLLQHAGGSSEGNAVRRGHSNGTASFSYTECPLPDMLLIAGNFNGNRIFRAAQNHPDLHAPADAVLAILFAQLAEKEALLQKRQLEVDQMGRQASRVRRDEQLNDSERMARALRTVCRSALCGIVARTRTWKQWTIVADAPTLWERRDDPANRAVRLLFDHERVIIAMHELARCMRRVEDAEMIARATSPEQSSAVMDIVKDLKDEQAANNRRLLQQIGSMMQKPLPPEEEEAPQSAPPSGPFVSLAPAAPSMRVKHKRETQGDVIYFSTWTALDGALDYAIRELAPMERSEGAAWRIRKLDDSREDKSRDKQWRCYRTLATAIGLLEDEGQTRTEALTTLQTRFDSLRGHTALLRELQDSQRTIRNAESIAKRVLEIA